jgi:hypothetical protein
MKIALDVSSNLFFHLNYSINNLKMSSVENVTTVLSIICNSLYALYHGILYLKSDFILYNVKSSILC